MRNRLLLNKPLTRSDLWPASLALIFLLLFVWQIPGTIALRNVCIGFLTVLAVIQGKTFPWRLTSSAVTPVLLVCLSGWMVLVIFGWGAEPSLSWRELAGQWGLALLCGYIGWQMGRVAGGYSSGASRLVYIIFAALLFQVVLHDLMDAVYWFVVGELPFRQAPVLYLPEIVSTLAKGGDLLEVFNGHLPDKFSYVNNVLAALLAAEVVQRVLIRRPFLRCSNAVLSAAILAVLVCSYLLSMRNGNVALLILMSVVSFLILTKMSRNLSIKRVAALALSALLVVGSLGWMFYRSDPRWQRFVETIPVALETQTNQTWLLLDGNYPRLSDGGIVEVSAYERLAWGKEGMKLIFDHPFGTGYNRNAFGDGIDKKYQRDGAYRGGHSHSGVIDFAIANGIPGLVLWLTILLSLFWTGWLAFAAGNVTVGLTLIFLVSGFVSRSFVDSNIRDHVLQQFMFLAGIFYVLSTSQRNEIGKI